MNNKYYQELRKTLKSKALASFYCSDKEYRKRFYYDYFYYIGSNEILSSIVVDLLNNNKLSTEEFLDIFYSYYISYFSSSPAHSNLKHPLFVSKKIDRDYSDRLIKKLKADTEEQKREIHQEGKQGFPQLVNLDITKEDTYFLQRVHNLIKEELIELEYGSGVVSHTKNKSVKTIAASEEVNYQLDEFNHLGLLKIGKKEIVFKKDRALVSEYFFELAQSTKQYKTYRDVSKYLQKDISSIKLRQDVSAINRRVMKETRGMIKGIIATKSKSRDKEINFYRWELIT